MRFPNTACTFPWRIRESVPDVEVEDVWALPTLGGPDDFSRLLQQITSGGPSFSGAARTLWKLRWKIGELLGCDRPDAGPGCWVPMLCNRLLADLRDVPEGVADLVEARAPRGFDDNDAVASHAEREAIVRGYAWLAGFAPGQMNLR